MSLLSNLFDSQTTTLNGNGAQQTTTNPEGAQVYLSKIYQNLTPDKAYQLGIATPSAQLLK